MDTKPEVVTILSSLIEGWKSAKVNQNIWQPNYSVVYSCGRIS